MGRTADIGVGSWLLILVVFLVVIGAVGLAVYGSYVHPVQHDVEQVLSNDRFPN